MCGIVGVISHGKFGLDYSDRELFIQMLTVGVLRGRDGTGVIAVDDKGNHRSLKIGDSPENLFADKLFKPFFTKHVGNYKPEDPHDRALIGHNRATSVGLSNTKNSHPFEHKHITLVHNGTLKAYSKLPDMDTAAVDSEALCMAIADLGIDEAISLSHGAYAIVYYDSKENTINFLRNSERPLAFAMDTTRDKLYFASEKGMLKWLLERENITDVVFSELKEDTLVTFKQGSAIPESREIKGPKIHSYCRSAGWYDTLEDEYLHPAIDRYYNQTAKIIPLPAVVEPAKPAGVMPKLLAPASGLPKVVKKAIKKMEGMGHTIEVLDSLNGLVRGDRLVFRVVDFIDKDPDKEQFIVVGSNRNFPNTAIKFHLQGAKNLDEIFESKEVSAYIKHMIHYPVPENDDEKHVIWVNNQEIFCRENEQSIVH